MQESTNQNETNTENQSIAVKKKLKKVFGHINPDNPPEYCPIRDILSPVSDKWSLLIVIFTGAYGRLRFNELKRKVNGISSKILAERLKTLERDGYISRKMYPQVPVKVEYRLTDFGLIYLDKILDLTEWLSSEIPVIVERRKKLN